VTITELREFQDATVVLQLNDGEVLRAKIAFADIEYEDIILDILETNKPEHYKDPNSAYTVKASDVASVQRIPSAADRS
jgi:hypothetical protein